MSNPALRLTWPAILVPRGSQLTQAGRQVKLFVRPLVHNQPQLPRHGEVTPAASRVAKKMRRRTILYRVAAALAAAALLAVVVYSLRAPPAQQSEITVMISGGLTAAYDRLVPQFERETGNKVVTAYGASMGSAEEAIPNRLTRGEHADVVILAAGPLNDLIAKGQVVPGSRVDLVRSRIGMVVQQGKPKPDISTVEALKQTLLAAQSIAYSDSASGTYLAEELFPKLGIADQIKGKCERIVGARVAVVVAQGKAEIGFQQISELLPFPDAVFVGPLPEEVQKVTVFSAGVAVGAKHPDAARALIQFLASPAAAPVLREWGLEPITK
jgi:molybdate transport system substrate-binding protein